MNDELNASQLKGLSSAEVAARVRAGQTNTNTDVPTKTIPEILAEHTFTPFNGVMVVLAALVLLTGAYENALFIFTVLTNIVIACFQEIRSKRALDKLSLLTARDATVIRDGQDCEVPVDELVLGDYVRLGRGDEVSADMRVVAGTASLNESLLTGESDTVAKRVGDELLSGSFVSAGNLVGEIVCVGEHGYAARISAEAKVSRHAHSDIIAAVNAVIRATTSIMLPLGLGLFLASFLAGGEWQLAVLTTVSALVGMIPQGLILLTSMVFAIAATRLAHHHVLVQQLYCTEQLARVDVVCLDKTGTITTGAMTVDRIIPASDASEDALLQALATLVHADDRSANETSRAIAALTDARRITPASVRQAIPFSSTTKCSGCVTDEGVALVMGAERFVLDSANGEVAKLTQGLPPLDRVLVVARCDSFDSEGRPQGARELLGAVAIADEIRSTAAQTIQFFADQGVELYVISGDDPETVSHIAAAAGVAGADKAVDASLLDDKALTAALSTARIFGRVSPLQKRKLVCALQRSGHTVAMTGDGVNDVLALHEADCSVAMASGADAARNVSDLVLTDNDFAHMPEVVAQGRQSINNLERSAALFLVKTVFSAALALISILLPPYPFLPVQMTLFSFAIIGVPSFLLALEPNHERIRGDFLTTVLSRSLPASAAIVACLFVTIIAARIGDWRLGETSTISLYLTAAIGIALIVRISQPLNFGRVLVLACVLAIFIGGCWLFPQIFAIYPLPWIAWLFTGVCAAGGMRLFLVGFDRMSDVDDPSNPARRASQRLEGTYGRRTSHAHNRRT